MKIYLNFMRIPYFIQIFD